MKSFRLIVSLRLALFPLVFNLSFAQEVEVSTDETVILNECEKSTEEITPMDSSSQSPQNDESTQDSSLSSEGQEDVEQPLSPSDSSPSREQSSSPDRGSGEAEGVNSEIPKDSSEQDPQNGSLLSSGTEGEGSYVGIDNFNTQDSSLSSEGQEDVEQPLSSSDSSPSREQNFQQLFPPLGGGVSDLSGEGVEGNTPMNYYVAITPQNDENAQEDEDSDEEPQPELIISEVYYDGTDEWIEIYNIGYGDFSGDIVLSGATSKNQTYTNIQIPANNFLIIADSDAMFDFSGNVNILVNTGNYKQFSITDTKEIHISLILSGTEVDFFHVHENRVKYIDGEKMSFQKVVSKGKYVVTWSLFSEDKEFERQNIIPGYIATPGILIETTENVEDMSVYIEEPEEEEPMDCGDVYQSPVTVSEVFRGGSRYNPYVEFDIHDDLEGYDFEYLELTGSLLKTGIFIDLLDEDNMYFDIEDLEKNTKLILTTTAGDLTEAGLITIVLQSDFELNLSGGELQLYGISRQDRQLLDIVKIGSKISEKSVYRPNSIHTCGEEMDNVNNFSPGFDESALKYFSVTSSYNEKIVEVVKYVGGGGGCSCPSKKDLCGTTTGNAVQTGSVVGTGDAQQSLSPSDSSPNMEQNTPLTGSEISPLTGGVSQSDERVVKIVSLESKSPESITLQSSLPYDIDFGNHNYYLKSSTSNSNKYIDGILYSNTIDTFTKNFGFADGGACVYLYSGDSTLDSYCYSSQEPEKQQKEEKSDNFNPSDYQLSITHIDYNPDGSDSGNETITIQSNSSKSLDLSKIKMKVNATTKKITGTLEPNSILTLKGSFGFPNSTKDGSDVVVILFYDNHIFSTYTYNPNKPKIEIPDGSVKVYSVIDGDTFRYRKEDGSLQSVRLLGVDAPESNTARYRSTECFGKEAKDYLTNLIKNQYVTFEYDENSASSDAYGRMLAYVYLDGKLVNETLIAEGYAKEYTYKTAYSHQSDFKQAEENARKSEKGLWSSSTCGKSIEEEPEAWGIDYEKLSIRISNVIYDPDGTDSGNEIVQLSVDNSQIFTVSSIDFSDDFSLTIFPRSEYSTGTTKNKKLSEFGQFDILSSSEITLKGNFGLPNNRATCVSLNQGSYTFDTRCYNPNGPLSDDETEAETGDLATIPNVKIQSIIPNPSGKDSGKEEITLLWTVNEDIQTTLDLSPDFSLLINGKTKKKLVGNLIPNQNITTKGSFGLPNSASCTSLLYKGETLDEFCYGKASDGVKFNSDNTSVHEIPTEELSIVKKITLVKQGDKLCVSYNKTLFSCKSIPNSTTEKNKKKLSMQNSFITQLENYIKSNYSSIYYNSEIKDYFELYSDAKKAIKAGSGDFIWNDSRISVTDISSLFLDEYEQDARDYFVEKMEGALPEILSLTLLQAEDEYNKKQVEKSDLGFLSFAK